MPPLFIGVKMSGYCPDCGNTLCLCDYETKVTYPYRQKIKELEYEIERLNKYVISGYEILIEELENNLKKQKKKLPLKDSFLLFLADWKAKMGDK